jgi:glycogen synthase
MHDYIYNHPQEKIVKRAKSFTWEKAADEYIKLYRKFL